MEKFVGRVVVDKERCKGCHLCVSACPFHILALSQGVNGKGYHFAEMTKEELCVGCGSCGLVCPDSVLSVYKLKVEDK